MNKQNMKCFHDNDSSGIYRILVVEYNCGNISRSVVHGDSGCVSFYYRDGSEHQVNVSRKIKFSRAFIKQYGIGITEDEKYFFLPRWESGLYCFELKTGKMIWKSTRRHPREYIVRNDTVICFFADQAVEVLSLTDGSSVMRYPFSNGRLFRALSDDLFLLGPKRDKYILLNEQLNVVLSIPGSVINPHRYDSFGVLSAALVEDRLRISGYEYWRAEEHKAIQEGRTEEHIANSKFTRWIPIRRKEDGGYILSEGVVT